MAYNWEYFSLPLTLASDGSTISMNNDYSGGAVNFSVTNARSGNMVVERLLVQIRDTGTFTDANFGAITLTNGISVQYTLNGTTITLTNANNIKTNMDFSVYCYDNIITDASAGDDATSARWTFGSKGITLKPTEIISMTLNDDLTGLSEMQAMVQGYYENS